MTENWTLILLVLLVIAVGLWWLLGKGKSGAVERSADKPAEPAKPVDHVAEAAPPVIVGEAVAPIDIPLPQTLVETPVVAEPAPKPAPEPAPAPAATGEPDNLLLLKGVGPKLAALLGTLGVTRFAQIAAWTEADIATIDAKLGTFKGRATRDKWVEQAGYLAKGDRAGFEAKFGKIDG